MEKKFLTFTILIFLIVFSACGDNTNEEFNARQPEPVQDSLSTLSGDFIYLADAAVLKGPNFIYGVTIDSVSTDLANKVASYKKESFDMVPVVVRAKILQNPGKEGWDEIIEIREVLEILAPEPDSVQNPSE